MREPGPGEAFRFAARVVADPAHAVRMWRAVSGGKAAGCLSAMPVPEILHAAGILPVRLAGAEITDSIRTCMDAWIWAPDGAPFHGIAGMEPRFEFPDMEFSDPASAMEHLESLAAWAGLLAGRPASEGALWRSIRTFREREMLLLLLEERGAGADPSLPDGGDAILVRAGDFLPPESHSRLLATVLRVSGAETSVSPGGERGDPLLELSRRLKIHRHGRNL